MDIVIRRKSLFNLFSRERGKTKTPSNLAEGKINVVYMIQEIRTDDQQMKDFLFTLGCYEGEEVTIISRLADNIVISVKDARYSINTELAKVIII